MAITYGSSVTAPELEELLGHLLERDIPHTPVCIWGRHGIGKTQIIRDFAGSRGWGFRQIAPAQFEEMGDLLGMPAIERGRTVLRPPSWVPLEPGPGILLIDDVNRADDRILRGIMQLLQDRRLVSWSLPKKWFILLTANPDEGDYSVTPLDEAMLTRMLHIHLRFDVHAWLAWAGQENLDMRGIDFVARHPELITGHRTTARSLVQFLQTAAPIADWRRQLPLVQRLASAALDEETVAGLLQFIRTGMNDLPSVEEVFRKGDSSQWKALSPAQYWSISERILRILQDRPDPLTETERQALRNYLLIDKMPPDLRMALAQRLTALPQPAIHDLLADPEVSGKLLA